jgi:hypothetical protein
VPDVLDWLISVDDHVIEDLMVERLTVEPPPLPTP